MRNILIFVFLAYLISALMGCAIRTKNGDYHFGPVLFRYQYPDRGKAYVYQTVNFPFWLEGGQLWGLGIGLKERTIVLPLNNEDGPEKNLTLKKLCLLRPFISNENPKPGQWNFSFLYLRAKYSTDEKFLAKKLYGFRLYGGNEGYAFTAGVTRTTLMEPAKDAFHKFRFNTGQPLDTEFRIWQYDDKSLSTLDILDKEVEP
ncbi:MAG: hypothetical protein GY797_14450 [Deltaproteobacteria bacterium]|nr:hypothetical protein [Deltaproteobacteria bacterium]